MCVANLSVSLQPCSHRWYTLVRPCSSSTNLSNCSSKVRLEGWESRVDDCPWCGPSSTDPNAATHKLFGGNDFSEARRRSDSTVASTDSFVRGRSNSISNSVTTFSAITSRSSSPESEFERRETDRAERNQMMNRRLDAYITTAVPDDIPGRRTSVKKSKPALAKKESSDSSMFVRRGSAMLGRWGSTKKKNRMSAIV
ncbi:ERAD-associated E3 ubiquitin-protein ligase HRD1 [Sphaceloma murrayae]|uniref:ERAD-associated E3 ubiquitin-protein ligase HRD1 n=1 Tax=Sphaceloma murrayae TaxID=2082308 RepID=A0A2K1QQC7_9PEZI|nr:ERAD-associated E3 ubiquitin-protein ligase HRD1 [Sphaceloma murrayae]